MTLIADFIGRTKYYTLELHSKLRLTNRAYPLEIGEDTLVLQLKLSGIHTLN